MYCARVFVYTCVCEYLLVCICLCVLICVCVCARGCVFVCVLVTMPLCPYDLTYTVEGRTEMSRRAEREAAHGAGVVGTCATGRV
jgi:hypothetical protein